MLSKLIKITPTVLHFASRNCKQQTYQLFYKPIYTFGLNANQDPNSQKTSESDPKDGTNANSKTDEKTGSTEQKHETEQESVKDYIFTTKEIYTIKTEYKNLAARQRGDLLMVALMLSAGAGSYIYIHPLSVIIPIYFMAGSFVSFFRARTISKSLCKSMELMNFVYVKLRMLSGEELVCKIDEIELLGIKEWNSRKKNAEPTNSYIVLGNFKDNQKKQSKEVRFIVDRKVTMIENIDLFRAILNKDRKELNKFELKEGYKPQIKDPKKTKYQFDFSEEEIDRLEQELKTSNKEKEK